MGRTHLGQQIGDKLLEGCLQGGYHLEHEQSHEDPIALGDVPAESHPARFLAPDEHIVTQDVVGDVIETHRGLNDLKVELLAQSVDHLGRGNRLDHLPTPAALFHQVSQAQGQDAVCIDILSSPVHGPDAIGISVRRQPKLAVSGGDSAGQWAKGACDGVRVDPAEARVHLGADLENLAACPLQDAFDQTASGAEHRVDHQA